MLVEELSSRRNSLIEIYNKYDLDETSQINFNQFSILMKTHIVGDKNQISGNERVYQ